jgi:hypothetical protein
VKPLTAPSHHRPGLLGLAFPAALVALTLGAVAQAEADPGSRPATTPTLSPAQENFESVALAANGGLHALLWNMPVSGKPVAGANPPQFIVDITSGGLKESPLTHGTQIDPQQWLSLVPSIKVPALPINLGPLVEDVPILPSSGPNVRLPFFAVEPGTGQVLPVSSDPTNGEQVSYVGANIRVDTFEKGSDTIAFSTLITAVNTVSVAGQQVASPTDAITKATLAQFHLTGNSTLLKRGATFAAGSKYVELTAETTGPELFIGDCALTETALTFATVKPCETDTALASPSVEYNYLDGTDASVKTWTLAKNGVICKPGTNTATCPNFNLTYWVASTPRTTTMNVPAESNAEYRVYVEIGSNVYTGYLVHAGGAVWENIGSDDHPDVQKFFLRANKEFVTSLEDALTF